MQTKTHTHNTQQLHFFLLHFSSKELSKTLDSHVNFKLVTILNKTRDIKTF